MSSEGQQQQAFDPNVAIATLSDDNKGFFQRKGWATPENKASDGFKFDAVVDSYRNLEKLTGKKTLEAPNLDDPEAFNSWEGHGLLGVPKEAKDYKFDKPALPDGLKWGDGPGEIAWDDKAEAALRTALLKSKVGQKQATAAFNELVQDRIAGIMAYRTEQANLSKTITTNLERDFGAGKAAALTGAGNAINAIAEKAKLDPAKVKDALANMMGDENAVRFAIVLGQMMGEGTLKGGGLDNGFAQGELAAKAEIDAFKADEKKVAALFDKANPGHASAKAIWDRLHSQIQPKK